MLFNVDDAQAGGASPRMQQLIADTKLRNAVPIATADCPLHGPRSFRPSYEQTDVLRTRNKGGGTLVLWAVCFDGNEPTCLDIHTQTPECN